MSPANFDMKRNGRANVIQWSMVPALDSLMAILRTPELSAELCRDTELWAEVKRLADVHRFTGHLAFVSAPFLPASERAWRDQVLMTHHQRHGQRLAGLRTIVEALAEEKIVNVSLKGPLLAERLYSQPYLRPCKDLDILVSERDIGRASRVMSKLHYRVRGYRHWSVHRNLDQHVSFFHSGAHPQVEMHYRLQIGGGFLSGLDFLDRSRRWRSPAGFEAKVLSTADDAFYCGVHAASHAFHRLRWLYDTMMIARVLTSEERADVRELTLRHDQAGSFMAASLAAREFFGEDLSLDFNGFALPRLWTELAAAHARRMVERVEGNTATIAEKIGYRIDLCRMASSPLKAAQLLASGAGLEIRKRWYDMTHTADPGALARTLPD